jgi:hypothetical protein
MMLHPGVRAVPEPGSAMSRLNALIPHPWGWATVAPVVCAVHCAAAPLLVVVAPALVENPALEFGLLGATVLLAGVALALGFRRHGNPLAALPVLAGVLAWWASLSHVFHPIHEDLTTAAAALVVAGGLLWNARLHCAGGESSGTGCASCQAEGSARSAEEGRPLEGGAAGHARQGAGSLAEAGAPGVLGS